MKTVKIKSYGVSEQEINELVQEYDRKISHHDIKEALETFNRYDSGDSGDIHLFLAKQMKDKMSPNRWRDLFGHLNLRGSSIYKIKPTRISAKVLKLVANDSKDNNLVDKVKKLCKAHNLKCEVDEENLVFIDFPKIPYGKNKVTPCLLLDLSDDKIKAITDNEITCDVASKDNEPLWAGTIAGQIEKRIKDMYAKMKLKGKPGVMIEIAKQLKKIKV